MRKSLILAITAIGGGVGYAAGVTDVATGPTTDHFVHLALARIINFSLPRQCNL